MNAEEVYNKHKTLCETVAAISRNIEPLCMLPRLSFPPPPKDLDMSTDEYFRLQSALKVCVPEFDELESLLKEPVTSPLFSSAFEHLFQCLQVSNRQNGDLITIFNYATQKVRAFIQLTLHEIREAAAGGFARTFREIQLEALCNTEVASVLDVTHQFWGVQFLVIFSKPYVEIAQEFVVSVIPSPKFSKPETQSYSGYIVLNAADSYQQQFSFAYHATVRLSRFDQQKIDTFNTHRGHFFEQMNAELEKARICSIYCHQHVYDFNFQARRSDLIRIIKNSGVVGLIQKVYMENLLTLPSLRDTDVPELDLLKSLLSFSNQLIFESELMEGIFSDAHLVECIIEGIFQDVFNDKICSWVIELPKTLPALVLLSFFVEELQAECKFENGSSINFIHSLKTFIDNELNLFVRDQIESLKSNNEEQDLFDQQTRAAKLTFCSLPTSRMLFLSGIIGCLLEAVETGLESANKLFALCVDTALDWISAEGNVFRRANELNLLRAMLEFVKIPTAEVREIGTKVQFSLKKQAELIRQDLRLNVINDDLSEEYGRVLLAHGLIGSAEAEEMVIMWKTVEG